MQWGLRKSTFRDWSGDGEILKQTQHLETLCGEIPQVWEDNKKDVDKETWMDHCKEVEDCDCSACEREEGCIFKPIEEKQKREDSEGPSYDRICRRDYGFNASAMYWEDQTKEDEIEAM